MVRADSLEIATAQELAPTPTAESVLSAVRKAYLQQKPRFPAIPSASRELASQYLLGAEGIPHQRIAELEQRYYFSASREEMADRYAQHYMQAARAVGAGVLVLSGARFNANSSPKRIDQSSPYLRYFEDADLTAQLVQQIAGEFEQIAVQLGDDEQRTLLLSSFFASRPYINSPADIRRLILRYKDIASVKTIREAVAHHPYDIAKPLRKLRNLTREKVSRTPPAGPQDFMTMLRAIEPNEHIKTTSKIEKHFEGSLEVLDQEAQELLEVECIKLFEAHERLNTANELQNAKRYLRYRVRTMFKQSVKGSEKQLLATLNDPQARTEVVEQFVQDFVLIAQILQTDHKGKVSFGWRGSMPQLHSPEQVREVVDKFRSQGMFLIQSRFTTDRSIEEVAAQLGTDKKVEEKLKRRFPNFPEGLINQAIAKFKNPEEYITQTIESAEEFKAELFFKDLPESTIVRQVFFYRNPEVCRQNLIKKAISAAAIKDKSINNDTLGELVAKATRIADNVVYANNSIFTPQLILAIAKKAGNDTREWPPGNLITAVSYVKRTQDYGHMSEAAIAWVIMDSETGELQENLSMFNERVEMLMQDQALASGLSREFYELFLVCNPHLSTQRLKQKLKRIAQRSDSKRGVTPNNHNEAQRD